MTLCDNKNKVSLIKEIKRLHYDIEKCEENLFGKQNYCTPSCCCHCFNKFWNMSHHKNYVSIARKKSDNNTITKLDIIPRCNNLKETCVTERAIVDVIVKKSPFKQREHKNRKSNTRYEVPKKVDAATDPILFSINDKKKYRDRPWGVILKDNLNEKNSKCRYCRPTIIDSIQTSSESTSSSDNDNQGLAHHCFMNKNVSTQCDEFKHLSARENSPIETIQIILKQLKKKLKDNAFMRNKLNELENELHRIFDFNANIQSITVEEENNTREKYPNFLTSKKISPPISEIDNISLLKLDETCRELENSCLILKKERDTSLQILSEKTAELMESKMREADIQRKFVETDSKIKEFSVKIENYAFSIKNLSEHINKLQTENEEMKKLEQQVTKLNGILKTVLEENKILLTDLQQVTVERNKLQLALTVNGQQKIQSESKYSSSTEMLIPEGLDKESKTTDSNLKDDFAKSSTTIKSSSNSPKSSPSLVLPPPFLYRSNSVSSLKTSSSLSEVDELEEKNKIISDIPNQKSIHSEHQTRLNNLNKLKDEVNNIFAEIKQFSDNLPSMPVIELNADDFSSDLSEVNGISSVNEFHG